jgi:large subunit ribosomal protein L24
MVSRQPRKQRKKLYKARLHERHKFLKATLSPSLRKKYGKRAVRVVKGDTVKILRGSHKGTEGKVEKVDMKHLVIHVEGVSVAKADGTEVPRPVHPSNVMITKLNLEDKHRLEIIERK